MGLECYKDLLAVLYKPNALQLQIFCIMVIAILRGLVFNVNSLLFGMTNIIACLNESAFVLSRIEGNTRSKAYQVIMQAYFIFLFGTFPFFIRIYEGIDLLRVFTFFANNMQEISISVLMFTLLNIVHISFEDINVKILSIKTHYLHIDLETLMFQHTQACELLDSLSLCFGFNIVLQYGYNLARIVLFSYYSYFMLVTRYKVNIDHVITATEVPYRLFAIWYLGRKCDQITYQARCIVFYLTFIKIFL